MTTATAASQLEAEIECQHCRLKKWVAWELRHSGAKVLPAGVSFDTVALCRNCPNGRDTTRWTGRTRWKPE